MEDELTVMMEKAEEMRLYVEQFAKLASGIEAFISINDSKEGDAEYFFEVMGIMARDKDTSRGEIIQYIPWKDFGTLVKGEAQAANAELKRLEQIIEAKIDDDDSMVEQPDEETPEVQDESSD